jgi:hypothetical protein
MSRGPSLTFAERAIIADHYPRIGATGCAELLPGRSPKTIQQAAARMGVRVDPPKADRAGGFIRAPKKRRPYTGGKPHHMGKRGPTWKRLPCLRCKVPFDSEGPGNRVCLECQATAAWRAGNGGGSDEPAPFGTAIGRRSTRRTGCP